MQQIRNNNFSRYQYNYYILFKCHWPVLARNKIEILYIGIMVPLNVTKSSFINFTGAAAAEGWKATGPQGIPNFVSSLVNQW